MGILTIKLRAFLFMFLILRVLRPTCTLTLRVRTCLNYLAVMSLTLPLVIMSWTIMPWDRNSLIKTIWLSLYKTVFSWILFLTELFLAHWIKCIRLGLNQTVIFWVLFPVTLSLVNLTKSTLLSLYAVVFFRIHLLIKFVVQWNSLGRFVSCWISWILSILLSTLSTLLSTLSALLSTLSILRIIIVWQL